MLPCTDTQCKQRLTQVLPCPQPGPPEEVGRCLGLCPVAFYPVSSTVLGGLSPHVAVAWLWELSRGGRPVMGLHLRLELPPPAYRPAQAPGPLCWAGPEAEQKQGTGLTQGRGQPPSSVPLLLEWPEQDGGSPASSPAPQGQEPLAPPG